MVGPIGQRSPFTGAASSIMLTSATVSGTVDPLGKATSYSFDYETTTAYGLQTSARPVPAGNTALLVSAALTGLSPGTTYHYRLSALNATTPRLDRTFRTALPPSVATGAATAVTATSGP